MNHQTLSIFTTGLGKRLIIGLATVALIGLASSPSALAAKWENPKSLTFAIIPPEESVAELKLYKPVTDRRAKLTGKN